MFFANAGLKRGIDFFNPQLSHKSIIKTVLLTVAQSEKS